MTRRGATGLALVSTFAALGALALTTAPAMAAQIHVLSKSFSLPSSGSPLQLAINQSNGKLYATDASNKVVDVFEATGAPDPTHPQLTEADGTTTYKFSNPDGVAVDNSAGGPDRGDIYVADNGGGAVLQFDPSGDRTAQASITAADVFPNGTSQSGGLPAVVNNGGFTPTGVAVATNGDVYVADQSNHVVDVFEPSGVFVVQIGTVPAVFGLAFGPSGNLYVASYEYGDGVFEFNSLGTCVNLCIPIGGRSHAVATDSQGNVYNDEESSIAVFNSSAEPIESFGSLSFSQGIAVNDTSGDVYVADGQIKVFEPVTVASLTIRPIASPGPQSGTLTGEVDPAAAGDVTACHFEYGNERGNYSLGTLPCLTPSPADSEIGTPTHPIESPTEVHADLSGLTTLTTYHYRLVATDAQGTSESPDHEFTPQPEFPTVNETSSSTLTPTSARMAAEINPGFGTTVFRFQYGPTSSYGSNTPISKPVGDDGTDHLATADLSGLSPSTTYHYRVVAINFAGTTHGPDQTFTTPDQPAVSGGDATSVTSSTATLAVQINPNLATTTYHFDYGTGTSYGSTTPESPSIGADANAHSASTDLSGLAPSTSYHFRAVATNPFGSTTGLDQTFTTASASPSTSSPVTKCRKSFIKRHGTCIKKPHHKVEHHKHGGKR